MLLSIYSRGNELKTCGRIQREIGGKSVGNWGELVESGTLALSEHLKQVNVFPKLMSRQSRIVTHTNCRQETPKHLSFREEC